MASNANNDDSVFVSLCLAIELIQFSSRTFPRSLIVFNRCSQATRRFKDLRGQHVRLPLSLAHISPEIPGVAITGNPEAPLRAGNQQVLGNRPGLDTSAATVQDLVTVLEALVSVAHLQLGGEIRAALDGVI